MIAEKAIIPALEMASNAELVAVGARDPARARALWGGRVVEGYQAVLDDPDVDAVYIPLPNHLHREWAIRALAAGKHVLCEKPLALNAAEAIEMAEAARRSGKLLMEAVMYRFHPRIASIVASLQAERPGSLWASFCFPIDSPGNYRLDPAMGGGALLDVGTYTISIARWVLGEPEWVQASGRSEAVDLTVSMTLGFPSGARAFLLASFDMPEVQELRAGSVTVDRPFTWMEGGNPYQLMLEEFSAAALAGLPAPLSLEDSIANLRVVDGVRWSLEKGGRYHLAETRQG